jgi:hypothetical protein
MFPYSHYSTPAGGMAPDMEVVSKMETEAAGCHWLAGNSSERLNHPGGGEAHAVIAIQDYPNDRRGS